jgi:hypothetical protein
LTLINFLKGFSSTSFLAFALAKFVFEGEEPVLVEFLTDAGWFLFGVFALSLPASALTVSLAVFERSWAS